MTSNPFIHSESETHTHTHCFLQAYSQINLQYKQEGKTEGGVCLCVFVCMRGAGMFLIANGETPAEV